MAAEGHAMSEPTPYIAVGPDELGDPLGVGDTHECASCGRAHLVEGGTDQHGKPSTLLGFVKCGEKLFLVSLAGKRLR